MDNSLLHSSIDERRRENYGNEYIYIYIYSILKFQERYVII